MHPYGLEDIDLVILYESSIILNNYIKYFVTLIYFMLLIILSLSLKQNFHRLKHIIMIKFRDFKFFKTIF